MNREQHLLLEQPGQVASGLARAATVAEEAAAFRQAWRRIAWTVARQTLSSAWLRVWLVIFLGGGLWFGLYLLFEEGFRFLQTAIPYADLVEQMVRYVFGAFFMALMLMLIISAAILLYGGLFRAPDTIFLFTQPVTVQRIFLAKLSDTVLMSGWAFIILSTPLLLGYATVIKAPFYFYLLMFPYLAAFVFIPACLGALICLAIGRYIPYLKSFLIAVAIVSAALLLVMFLNWVSWLPRTDALTVDWLQNMLNRLSVTQFRLSPSWWLSTGLLSAAHGNLRDGGMFFLVILANALMLRTLSVLAAGRAYRPAFYSLAELGRKKRKVRTGLRQGVLLRYLPGLRQGAGYLITKDIKLFVRDPTQWSQMLIFMGLLVLYFVNIRRLYYERFYFAWMNMVSFLNVAVVALLLSTFTTRFIYPLISLEGPRFWVLGLMPISRRTVVSSKLGFALCMCVLPCCGLVLLSDLMIGVEPIVHFAHQYSMLLCCIGLTSLAVGLGARYPNFRSTSAARIASGFGGTVNLIAGTALIGAILGLGCLPVHVRILTESPFLLPTVSANVQPSVLLTAWIDWGPPAAVLLTAAVSISILVWGIRHFQRVEF